MSRPCKIRRICNYPMHCAFAPKGKTSDGVVTLLIDEYETIRLIDLEGLDQEACAMRMQVARTTVQTIYMNARRKVAECLVYGKELVIAGGDVELCDGKSECCHHCHCLRRCEGKEEKDEEDCRNV